MEARDRWARPCPHVRPFRVSGIFNSGMYEYDTKWTYVAIPDLQAFLKTPDKVTGFEVKGHDIEEAATIKARIDKALGYPSTPTTGRA